MFLNKGLIYDISPSFAGFLKGAMYLLKFKLGRFRSPEPEFEVLSELIKDGDQVIDVGANVGHYTLRMATLVGDNGQVLSIEPMYESYKYIKFICSRRKINNVILAASIASNVRGIFRVSPEPTECSGPNFYRSKIDQLKENTDYTAAVPSLILDDFVAVFKPSLIKIDVEGHEMQVIEGARKMIKYCKPILVIEDNKGFDSSIIELSGYRSCRFINSPNIVFVPENNEALMRLLTERYGAVLQ